MNTDAPWPSLDEARLRVLKIQTKLHQWAVDDAGRRFDDLFNLVTDPAFLTVAWDRVRGNRGARSAGVDGVRPRSIVTGEVAFLAELRQLLKSGEFAPLPVRQRMIPKANGKLRSLGIPTARDRVVQASVKLVLEPIFEAGFHPCSYGFRPRRRAHDAIAEIHMLASNEYSVVLEGDITACFDEIDHAALLGRVRDRIGDRRVVRLIRAFLKAGVLTEDGHTRDTKMGTPQGGILSPLLANIALSVLDDHFAEVWERDMATRVDRARRRRQGAATYRLVRYADDFVVMVAGTKAHAKELKDTVEAVLSTVGLRLSEEKTMIVTIDEGFDFLGFRIQRQTKRGSNRRYVYTWPTKKAFASIKAKVKTITRQGTNQPLSAVLRQLNGVLRGWTNYFRHAVSKATFAYLHHYTWWRVVGWLRRKHRRANWKWLRRRYLANRSRPEHDGVALFECAAVPVTRYRYRGTRIPTPWSEISTAD
ncbi:MAG TPA: group II intron reverse transcriptase/maturase [Ilumatobacter sp.]|nr:group II intron reverse transcriptase/maturase [Ilumatobacter sp.]